MMRHSMPWRTFLPLFVLCIATSSCRGGGATAPTSGFQGSWSGTTSLGTPISFTISANQIITDITVSYNFNGCSGTKAYSGLAIPIRMPTPQQSLPGFEFASGAREDPDFVGVTASLNGSDAAGLTAFTNYQDCRNGIASWDAHRR